MQRILVALIHGDARPQAVGERLDTTANNEERVAVPNDLHCTEACPREIRITKAIGEVKKALLKGSRDIPVRQAATSHG